MKKTIDIYQGDSPMKSIYLKFKHRIPGLHYLKSLYIKYLHLLPSPPKYQGINPLKYSHAPIILAVFSILFFQGTALADFAPPAVNPGSNVVKILYPLNGWSEDRIIELDAEINDAKIQFAFLVENGSERMVRVRNGHVREKLVLSPGTNHIIVEVLKNNTIHLDHVSLYSEVPKKDIKIILTWDTDGTDVDLHVINPQNVDCYYGNMETEEGGKLDVDITDGYGPEVFTQTNASPGTYQVKAHYYGSHGQAQSVARVQVLLFEGTDMEKK